MQSETEKVPKELLNLMESNRVLSEYQQQSSSVKWKKTKQLK